MLPTLYVQYKKNPALKKWLPFKPICACNKYSNLKRLPSSNLLEIWIWHNKKMHPAQQGFARLSKVHNKSKIV